MNSRVRVCGNRHIDRRLDAAVCARLFRTRSYFIRQPVSRTKQQLAAVDIDHDRACFRFFHDGRKRVSKVRQGQIRREVLAVNTSKHDDWSSGDGLGSKLTLVQGWPEGA